MKWLIEGHFGFLVGLVSVGSVCVLAGSIIDSGVMMAVGGALLGGSISSLISKIDAQQFQDKALGIIHSTLTSKFLSEEIKIKRFRKLWNVYYGTKVNGAYEWRHVTWDLREQKGIGVLSGVHITYDQEGRECEYQLECGMRDQRIIVLTKAIDSDEPCSITVMPFMGENYHNRHYGVEFHKTWDGNDSISPVIVCDKPIEGYEDFGPITDEEKLNELSIIWNEKFSSLNEILPHTTANRVAKGL